MLANKTDLEKLKETLDAIGKKYETICDLDNKDQQIMKLYSDSSNPTSEKNFSTFCLAMSFNKGKLIHSWMDTHKSVHCIFFEYDLTKYFKK